MDLANSRIVVTGATGFLGRYIVDNLLERGAHVIGVARNPQRVPELAKKGVELRKADLNDKASLIEGFRGADAVVANAALFSPLNFNWKEHQAANIQGVQNTLDAMHEAEVNRLVHISSMAIYSGGPEPVITESRGQYSEHSKKRPWTVYSISKALSEQLAVDLSENYKIDMTAIRPCAVYGAFDSNFTTLFKKLWGGTIGLNITGPSMRLVYAGDVAEAVSLSLENSGSKHQSYNIAGEERIELSALRKLWKSAGGPVARLNMPISLSSSSGTPVSIEKAQKELDWKNSSIEEALIESFLLESNSNH
jgi:nucleoside-diphosphate-sugar epimerase